MNSFFDDLKRAREAQNISLGEIADATLINIKMLEELEVGNVDLLPQAYIRAFLREYAGIVGLDPKDTLDKYESWLNAHLGRSKETVAVEKLAAATSMPTAHDRLQKFLPNAFKLAFAFAVLILVDIVVWNILEKDKPPVTENPFGDVVRESEARAGFLDTATEETKDEAATRFGTDSLTLALSASDSVWMQMVIDDKAVKEYLFYPRSSFAWKAKNNFFFPVIGNPTAVAFTLNGKPLATPGKRGAVTRNLRYTRDSLRTR